MAAEPVRVLSEDDVRRGIQRWCYEALEHTGYHMFGTASVVVRRLAMHSGDAWVERLEFSLQRGGFQNDTAIVNVFYAAGLLRFTSDWELSVRIDTQRVTQAVLDRTLESVRRRIMSVSTICSMFKIAPENLEA